MQLLKFVRTLVKSETVAIETVNVPHAGSQTKDMPVDSSMDELIVSLSGSDPQIELHKPDGELNAGDILEQI